MTKKSGVSDGSQLSRRGARRPLSTGKRCACENGLNEERSDAGGGGEGLAGSTPPVHSTPAVDTKQMPTISAPTRSGVRRRKERVGLQKVERCERGQRTAEYLSRGRCSVVWTRSLCNIRYLLGNINGRKKDISRGEPSRSRMRRAFAEIGSLFGSICAEPKKRRRFFCLRRAPFPVLTRTRALHDGQLASCVLSLPRASVLSQSVRSLR